MNLSAHYPSPKLDGCAASEAQSLCSTRLLKPPPSALVLFPLSSELVLLTPTAFLRRDLSRAIIGASEIIVSPSAMLSSLGIMVVHNNLAKALDEAGIERTYITSSRFKAEGNETAPLSAEARGELQKRVDSFDQMMSRRIASGRGVSIDRVRSGFGEGRIVMAAEAVRGRGSDAG